MSGKKKILLVTNYQGMWPFSDKLPGIYNKHGYDTDILDYNGHRLFNYKSKQQHVYFKKTGLRGPLNSISIIQHSLFFNRAFKKQLKQLAHYHAIIVFYHSSFLNQFTALLKQKTNKIVIIYAGSDFYRASARELSLNRKLLDASSKLVFTNAGMARDLTKHYNKYTNKFTVNHFGLDIVDRLLEHPHLVQDRKEPPVKITIGYNGAEGQQHLKIIRTIAEVVKGHPGTELVFPVTYAAEAGYLQEIKSLLADLKLKAVFYEKKLPEVEVAQMRADSDIVINMQISDQASGSLVEYLATGNVMLVADWLPYTYWDDLGFHYSKVNFDSLASSLSHVLQHYREEKTASEKNKTIAFSNFSSQSRLAEVLQIIE